MFKQGCLFVNNSDQALSWTLNTKAAGPLMEDGTFKFLHRTGSPFTPSSAGKKSVIPDITLESGETFQLGVLFTPRKTISASLLLDLVSCVTCLIMSHSLETLFSFYTFVKIGEQGGLILLDLSMIDFA